MFDVGCVWASQACTPRANREWSSSSRGDDTAVRCAGQRSFEVHLPQGVGRFALETQAGLVFDRLLGSRRSLRRRMAVMVLAAGGCTPRASGAQRSCARPRRDWPPARRARPIPSPPGWLEGSCGPPAAVLKSRRSAFPETLQPFVRRFSTHSVPAAQLTDIGFFLPGKHDKLLPKRHAVRFLPGHLNPLPSGLKYRPLQCVTHVSEQVLPMCPVYTVFSFVHVVLEGDTIVCLRKTPQFPYGVPVRHSLTTQT